MAIWRDFKAYVKSTYHVTRENPQLLQLDLSTRSDRAQTVYLSLRRLSKRKEEWLVIESPFAKHASVDLTGVLEEAGRMVCGGVTIRGAFVVYRHSLPLANLDANEFRRPLEIVTASADHLEQMFSSQDAY